MNGCRFFRSLLFLLVGLGHGFGCAAKDPAVPVPPLAELPAATAYVFHGRVVSRPNSPVAGAEVALYGAKHATREIVSDAEGRFEFVLDENLDWHSSMVAKKGGQVSAYLYLYPEEDLTAELHLGEPSTLRGRVTLDDSAPATGATVWLAPEKGYGASIAEGITDTGGNYEIPNVAPGVYGVHLTHERFTLTERDDPLAPKGPTVTLESGGTTARDLEVAENAFISGKLIGPNGAPVAGQKISSTWDLWNHPLTSFETDENGNFSGFLPPWHGDRSFRIEHPTLGFGMLNVPPLSPGQRLDGLEEKLSGTMRLTGIVTGVNGAPVPGVRVCQTETDSAGRYDTGWIYLEEPGRYTRVDFSPPGQYTIQGTPQTPVLTIDSEGNPVMYGKTFKVLQSTHGQSHEIPVRLIPMKSRKLRGAVTDGQGLPVVGATVLVYQGDALTEQWIAATVPEIPRGPEPRRKNWRWSPPQGVAFLMDRLITDAQGRWETTVFPVPISMDCIGRPMAEPLQHTVAVMDQENVQSGISRVFLQRETIDPVDINVRLQPIDGREMVDVAVRAQDGAPLPGIAWVLNCDYGYLVSDSDGVVTVPRIAMTIDLALKDTHYCILDVQTSGTIERAPDPEEDSGREWVGSFERDPCHRVSFSGQLNYVPQTVDWNKQWINMPYFDATKGGLTITVGVCEE